MRPVVVLIALALVLPCLMRPFVAPASELTVQQQFAQCEKELATLFAEIVRLIPAPGADETVAYLLGRLKREEEVRGSDWALRKCRQMLQHNRRDLEDFKEQQRRVEKV